MHLLPPFCSAEAPNTHKSSQPRMRQKPPGSGRGPPPVAGGGATALLRRGRHTLSMPPTTAQGGRAGATEGERDTSEHPQRPGEPPRGDRIYETHISPLRQVLN